MSKEIIYKNRYGSEYTFTVNEKGNIQWCGDFEYCRYGFEDNPEDIIMVDPSGGPYIDIDYDMEMFGKTFKGMKVLGFIANDNGYELVINKEKTKKMKNEFIPYKEARLLKELGFNERCLACYDEKGVFGLTVMSIKKYYTNSKEDTWNCAAPLYQQAFRWFREEYDIDGYPQRCGQGYAYQIYIKFGTNDNESIPQKGWCKSYEEAELECLRKLIEIVKNKEDEK